jgi:hypothetical protein
MVTTIENRMKASPGSKALEGGPKRTVLANMRFSCGMQKIRKLLEGVNIDRDLNYFVNVGRIAACYEDPYEDTEEADSASASAAGADSTNNGLPNPSSLPDRGPGGAVENILNQDSEDSSPPPPPTPPVDPKNPQLKRPSKVRQDHRLAPEDLDMLFFLMTSLQGGIRRFTSVCKKAEKEGKLSLLPKMMECSFTLLTTLLFKSESEAERKAQTSAFGGGKKVPTHKIMKEVNKSMAQLIQVH